jgi:Na+-driven multidrug efflux pump
MQIATEILRKGMPVPGRRIVETGSRITFMFVISVLGTPGVAASAIVRRFKTFALIPGTVEQDDAIAPGAAVGVFAI